MNVYDQAARYAAKLLDALGFLRWLLPAEVWLRWRWAGWLDTQNVTFPGEPDRRCDTAARFERIAGDRPPVAAVVEFQTRPRGDLPERLAEYLLRLRRELPYQGDPLVRYDAVGVLVNLTGPAQAGDWSTSPPDFGGLGLWARSQVRTLREEDARATLAGVAAGQISRAVLAWVPLFAGADQPEVVQQWAALAQAEPDSRRRADLGGLARVFADLADRSGVWASVLEGWNVEESQVVLEWQAKARAQERAEVLRANTLRVVRSRFGVEPPADLVAAVQAQADATTLDGWFDLALDSPSLEAFRAAIGLP